ncbi:hypothetical protein J3R08_001874 [Micromonospora sp. HB375]|uniref:hypothetical protein n=1 Tax=Micromonospora sp. H404/HB375 TaxID=2940569 RepID=UPI001AE942A8|nr:MULTISPECIES: hypothetical protein [unclassified Micromonospora]MBP1782024.1 hypothetical protein [Micromonospora sp. HB375]MDH6471382.1 hypothetical protein [Micromonospora sp. H404/HB375]
MSTRQEQAIPPVHARGLDGTCRVPGVVGAIHAVPLLVGGWAISRQARAITAR